MLACRTHEIVGRVCLLSNWLNCVIINKLPAIYTFGEREKKYVLADSSEKKNFNVKNVRVAAIIWKNRTERHV